MSKLNLIVGCGGSGLTTITALNKLLVQNQKLLPNLRDEFYYLAVDTEEEALNNFEKNINAQMGKHDAPLITRIQLSEDVSMLNDITYNWFVEPFSLSPDDKGLERLRENWWFDSNGNPFNAPHVPPLNIGAGQCPPASYCLAWYRLEDIGEAIKSIVDDILKRGNAVFLQTMNIIIVAGLSGGTGRGCWSLIAFKIREYLLNKYNYKIPPIGIFFDANVYENVVGDNEEQRLALQVNSLTGLSELSCWMKNGRNNKDKEGIFRYCLPNIKDPSNEQTDVLQVNLELNPTSGAPVNRAYLICGQSKVGKLDKNEYYHEMAGTGIYAMIANPAIVSRDANDNDPYNSFGASSFEVDALHIRSFFEVRAREIALTNLETSKENVSVDEFLKKYPFDDIAVQTVEDLKPNAQGNLYKRAVDALFKEQNYKESFDTISSQMGTYNLQKAQLAITPLLTPADDAIIDEVVKKVLSDFGIYGEKGEDVIFNAMKGVYSQEPHSVARARDFLEKLEAKITAALAISPAALQIKIKPMTGDPTDPNAAMSQILTVLSKRTAAESWKNLGSKVTLGVIEGVGAFNKDEIKDLFADWGIVAQCIAAQNYPKIKEAFEEAYKPILEKIAKLISACNEFAKCCRIVRESIVIEEDQAVRSNEEDTRKAFEILFSTPDNLEQALHGPQDSTRFYHRLLKPIVKSIDELDDKVKKSIYINDALDRFISSVVEDGTLENIISGKDKNINARGDFIKNLMKAIRENVSLSEDFMIEHFTFRKVLEGNYNYWNKAIAAVQGDSVHKNNLYKKFELTLGAQPRIDKDNPQNPPMLPPVDELQNTIAASLAENCAPWWLAEKTGAQHSVMMLVPFAVSNVLNDFKDCIKKKNDKLKVTPYGLTDISGCATPFSYVAFASEGLTLEPNEIKKGMHYLDKIRSFDYYKISDINAWMQKAESPDGESIFTDEKHNKGIGHPSPIFVHNSQLVSYRWKPWLNNKEALEAAAENQALDVILYALLGTGVTDSGLLEKLANYGWSLPAIQYKKSGQVWSVSRKTLVWDDEDHKATSNDECDWSTDNRICTSACNLITMFEGKGKTGRNGRLKETDVEEGNKIKKLLLTEKADFEKHIAPNLGDDLKKLIKARKAWLIAMRDDSTTDEDDKAVFDALLKRSKNK